MRNLSDDVLTHPTLLHPRTGEPLQTVGVLPTGRVVWPMIGGDGSEDDANDRNDDDTNDGNDDEDGDDEDQDEDGDGDEDDAEDAKLKQARKDAAKRRTQAREARKQAKAEKDRAARAEAELARLRKAAGGNTDDGDDDDGDDEQDQRDRDRDQRLQELELRDVVRDIAGDNRADAAALLDSRRFMRRAMEATEGLDPEDDDYRDELAEAIRAAVKRDKKLRAGQGSGRGGSEISGGSRERGKRPKNLQDAISRRMSR